MTDSITYPLLIDKHVVASDRGAPKLDATLKHTLMKRTPLRTSLIYINAVLIIALAMTGLLLEENGTIDLPWYAASLSMIILGLVYAHFTELQHELLHGHAFKSQRLNRGLGFICGLFMLNSFSHYKYHHLRHHRHLGTPQNSEFFNYPEKGMDSPWKLASAALNPGRFIRVGALMFKSLTGAKLQDIEDSKAQKHTRQEYCAYFFIVAAAVAFTLLTGSWFLVLAWLIPMVLIAEPAHYLIELPEHFGLDAYTEPNFNRNTRSIEASPLARWYTNANNLHTAHHSLASVPMGRCQTLHDCSRASMEVIEPDYWTFYRKVMSGELKPFNRASQ
jgi:fatty acid desaturase